MEVAQARAEPIWRSAANIRSAAELWSGAVQVLVPSDS